MKISIVIPLYNEAHNIPELYRRLCAALIKDFGDCAYEIIAVDDGSTDGTFAVLADLYQRDKQIKVIQFSRNFGHHVALTAGLDEATGDYAVMMDGDLQDQPEEIIKLYRKLNEGYDIVYGERAHKQFGWIKRLTANAFNAVIRRFINERIVINSTIFRIMKKPVVVSLKQLREHDRYIIGLIGWVGFKQAATPVEHGKRYRGRSTYTLSKQLQLAGNAIFSFSTYPLKLITRLGLFFVLVAFIYGFTIIYRKVAYHTPVLGWSSLIVSILIIGGVQIIIVGMIGEYVGRNYMESKRRPLYIVKTFLHD